MLFGYSGWIAMCNNKMNGSRGVDAFLGFLNPFI